jgi:hypothetical protein
MTQRDFDPGYHREGSNAADAFAAGVAPGPKSKSRLRGGTVKAAYSLAPLQVKLVPPNAVSLANADRVKRLLARARF